MILAVTLTDMFMGLLVGRYVDKVSRILPIVLVLNLFQIGGSLLYFVGISPAILLISRLIEGLGNGANVVFLTDVCRQVSKEFLKIKKKSNQIKKSWTFLHCTVQLYIFSFVRCLYPPKPAGLAGRL
jgi:MFS family permease